MNLLKLTAIEVDEEGEETRMLYPIFVNPSQVRWISERTAHRTIYFGPQARDSESRPCDRLHVRESIDTILSLWEKATTTASHL